MSPPRRRPGRGRSLLAAAAVSALAACGSGSPARVSATAPGPAAPARAPRLLMTDAGHGFAIWPAGSVWALLRTAGGWRQQVGNASPPAVDTSGGLDLALAGSTLVVGVRPTGLLTVSPYLASTDSGSHWTGGQLPGQLGAGSGGLALLGGRLTAVLSGRPDRLVAADMHGGWTTLASAGQLDPGGGLRLDAVTWAGAGLGWLTGHGPAGTPVVFRTVDSGRSWTVAGLPDGGGSGSGTGASGSGSGGSGSGASRSGSGSGGPGSSASGSGSGPGGAGSGSAPVAALAPCGSGTRWLLPILHPGGSDRIVVDGTVDGGRTWSRSISLPAPTGPAAWGCTGGTGWLLAGRRAGDHAGNQLWSTVDGGVSWRPGGRAPAGITDLAPTGGGQGFAAGVGTGGGRLWGVSGNGSAFSPITLPAWVQGLDSS